MTPEKYNWDLLGFLSFIFSLTWGEFEIAKISDMIPYTESVEHNFERKTSILAQFCEALSNTDEARITAWYQPW